MITASEAQTLATARALTAQVIRVDDFAQDLGASEMRPVSGTSSVAVAKSVVHKANAPAKAA